MNETTIARFNNLLSIIIKESLDLSKDTILKILDNDVILFNQFIDYVVEKYIKA